MAAKGAAVPPSHQPNKPFVASITGPDLTTPLFAKFDRIQKRLDFAGFEGNYHTLNQLSTYHREIILVDDVGLHLLWKQSPVAFHFIKPLPRAFINDQSELAFPDSDLSALSRGFLYSYTRLIQSELDLSLGLKHNVVDNRFSGAKGWTKWTRFVRTFRDGRSDQDILKQCDARYQYGDLRLDRLNSIMWALYWGEHFYHTRDPFHSFWQGYGKWIIIIFAYVSTTLSAMQVALTVTADPAALADTFKWFSYLVLLLIWVQVPFALLFFTFLGFKQAIGWLRGKKRSSHMAEKQLPNRG